MAKRPHVMLIVETSLIYGREILRGISKYLVAHGPWSLYLDLRELMVAPPKWLDSWKGDGIISRSTTPELAERLQRLKIPTVDLTDVYGNNKLPHIGSDNHAIGRIAAEHLLERGFRRFAFCGYDTHDWSIHRREGFKETLAKQGYGCKVFESSYDREETSWEEQQQKIADWLLTLPKPVGIMASNDMRGQHVLDACRRVELAVPEEVAVIGVDNDELLCELCQPPLSSVMPNPRRIGYQAAALLDQMMRGEQPGEKHWALEPLGIVSRQSTDVLAIDDTEVASALRFIREHACEGITVSDVLKHVPTSRSVLERRFRRQLGRSPQIEIRLVQIKRIKQLLEETELSLERIAALTGFTHPEYMSVVFKRETGQTPGQYRRSVQPETHLNADLPTDD